MTLLFSPGSDVCPSDRPLPHLSLSKSIPALRIQDKNKVTLELNSEVGSVSNIVRESLVFELHKIFSGAIKEIDLSTKKPKVERLHENLSISGVSNGESPENVSSVIKYQKTDRENLSELFLETSQRTPTMVPLPGLVDKLIESPSKTDSYCKGADTKKKSLENLWQERNIVRDSGILSQLSKEQLKLQEVPKVYKGYSNACFFFIFITSFMASTSCFLMFSQHSHPFTSICMRLSHLSRPIFRV